jgi:hypothetical protein
MVGIEHEFPVYKVMPPMFEGLYKGIQFQIVCGISPSSLVEFFAEKGNGMVISA